ncbi:MAG: hypothetical protein ABIJ52_13005 [Pseudomonadota bacterium]
MVKTMKCIIGFFFVITTSSLLWAGNRDMVEKRVDELDKLNKEALNQIAGQPESGIINIRVKAIPEKDGYRFEPIDKETTSSMPDTFLPQESGDKFFSFREGIARRANNKPAITPYKFYGNEGEFISFKDAIIRLSRRNK